MADTASATFEKVKKIIVDQLGVDEAEVTVPVQVPVAAV